MKNLHSSGCFSLFVFVALVFLANVAYADDGETGSKVAASASVDARQSRDPIIERLEAFYDKTTDYKATFTQVVTTKSPKRRFTRSGSVYFKRPGMMRWDYSVPDEVYYVSNGDVLWSYDVEEGTVFKLKVGKSRLYQALGFLTGTAKLDETFRVEAAGPDAVGRVRVHLYPKADKGDFKRVTLFVDATTGSVAETEVEDPLGNVSRVKFVDATFEPLPVSGFDFKVPDGVKVQDLSKEGAK